MHADADYAGVFSLHIGRSAVYDLIERPTWFISRRALHRTQNPVGEVKAVAILEFVRFRVKRLRGAAGVIAIPRVLCFGDGRLWYEQGGGLVRAESSKDAGTVGTKTITAHGASACLSPDHEPSS